MTPEGKLKADCRKIAKRYGLPFWNIEGKQIKGIPDTLVGKHPLGSGMIVLEAKRPGVELNINDPLDQQAKRIREIRAAGGQADWYNSIERFRQLIGLDADPLEGL